MIEQPTVLLVDDSPFVHQVYGQQLLDAGFRVIDAEDGVAAINAAFLQIPDVIVLDIYMPKINGYQVCRLLKDHPDTKMIPIILITSGAAAQLVSDPKKWGFGIGADAYLEKGETDLIGVIRPLLARAPVAKRPIAQRRALSEVDIMIALSTLLDQQLYRDVSHLQDLNEKKSAFVSLVAHELKAPLTVIKGCAGNLRSGVYGDLSSMQQESVSMIERTTERATRLIRELLDLARIEGGRILLDRQAMQIGALVRDVVNAFESEARKKTQRVSLDMPTTDITIRADRDRLEQVFINLFTNAIKFTPEGGTIQVRLVPRDGCVHFEIQNDGPGIAADDLERIFHLFERLDASRQDGIGLGLPIAQTLTELHGGRLWAESDGVSGCTFIVELPLSGLERQRR